MIIRKWEAGVVVRVDAGCGCGVLGKRMQTITRTKTRLKYDEQPKKPYLESEYYGAIGEGKRGGLCDVQIAESIRLSWAWRISWRRQPVQKCTRILNWPWMVVRMTIT